MKKLITILLVHALLSCSTDEPENSNLPKSKIPDELVGYWIAGSTSIGNFWDYNGSYKGPANEIAVGYMFHKDGTAKEYFYYTSTSTYCRTQVLGYKEGTLHYSQENKDLEMFYASGNYRSFNSCGTTHSDGFGEQKKFTKEELYPAKTQKFENWEILHENGKQVLTVPLGNGEFIRYEKSNEPQK